MTWNCRSGSVAARVADLAALTPDVVFLQECAPAEALTPADRVLAKRVNPRKGIALASLSSDVVCTEVRPDPIRDSPSIFATVTRSTAAGERPLCSVLGLWAHGPNYGADVCRALDLHSELLRTQPTIVMGDLNSGSRLGDRQALTRNHRRVITAMTDLGLVSAYHAFHDVDHGREAHPTYYHLAKRNDPWHIDFCFVPRSWARHITQVHVAGADEMTMSDHQPVLVELAARTFSEA